MTVHQGVLYVTNSNPPQGVQQFDATTGVNNGNFVPSLVNAQPRDVKVNPGNNHLYVLYYNAATVEMLDLTTKASLGLLMPAGSPIGSGWQWWVNSTVRPDVWCRSASEPYIYFAARMREQYRRLRYALAD
jgi:hypothetical protein